MTTSVAADHLHVDGDARDPIDDRLLARPFVDVVDDVDPRVAVTAKSS